MQASVLRNPSIGRRAILVGGLALSAPLRASAAALPIPAGGKIVLEARRNGVHIGREVVTFRSMGDDLNVEIEVRLMVKLGPVSLFDYRFHVLEHYRAGRFASLESRTVINGKVEQVSAQRTAAGVVISATDRKLTAPADASPLTHWNQRTLTGPLFNPQTGALMRLTAKREDGVGLTLADGQSVGATRYTLSGEASIVDWFDPSGLWAYLKAPDKLGAIVEFRRV